MTDYEKRFIKSIFSGDSSGHDYYHTIRVYKLATKIAKQENADVKTVQLAALLHDVDDIKLSPDTYVTKKNAVDFMTINKKDGKRLEAVCKIIDEVSFAGTDSVVPDTIEGKCVQDADRLDAIGAIGIARTFAYGGSRGRKIYDPEIKSKIKMNKDEYQKNKKSSKVTIDNIRRILSLHKRGSLHHPERILPCRILPTGKFFFSPVTIYTSHNGSTIAGYEPQHNFHLLGRSVIAVNQNRDKQIFFFFHTESLSCKNITGSRKYK